MQVKIDSTVKTLRCCLSRAICDGKSDEKGTEGDRKQRRVGKPRMQAQWWWFKG